MEKYDRIFPLLLLADHSA